MMFANVFALCVRINIKMIDQMMKKWQQFCEIAAAVLIFGSHAFLA
jgi:hypothetical protein